MNSKCVTAGQILRFLAYSAVESVRLCVHAHSVWFVLASFVCVFLDCCCRRRHRRRRLRGECANFCVRRITLSFLVSKIWRLRCSRLVRFVNLMPRLVFSWFFLDFFLIFFRVFFSRAPCSSSFFCFCFSFSFVRFRFVTVCFLRILRRGKSVAMMQCAPDRI
jgi:hypothetical protein